MKATLHAIQQACHIFNSDIEPQHTSQSISCDCDVHKYKDRKSARLAVQEMWSKAVMYPGQLCQFDDISCVAATV